MICFLSGGYGPGGAQSIQLCLFKALVARGESCKLFDLKDGWVHKTFIDTGLPFDFIEIQNKDRADYSSHLSKDDLLIVFDCNLFGNMLIFPKSDCKVIVWEIYYPWVERFIYTRYFPIKYLAQRQELLILKLIAKNNAFYFIDVMGKEAVEKRIQTKISNSKYLPIPIDDTTHFFSRNESKESIILSYVGRSIVWKINPLIKVISDIFAFNLESKIHINIVCDNVLIFDHAMRQIVPMDKISFSYYEKLNGNQLCELLKKSDIHIAMGTAALDGAKLGIPTILIDGSFDILPVNYRYRWIYETEHLNLGRIIDKNTKNFDGKHTFSDVLESIYSNRKNVSEKCLYYVIRNYNVDIAVSKIVVSQDSTTLTMRMFNEIFVYKYFKVLRYFGII